MNIEAWLRRTERHYENAAVVSRRAAASVSSGVGRAEMRGRAQAYEEFANRLRRVRLLVLTEDGNDLAP